MAQNELADPTLADFGRLLDCQVDLASRLPLTHEPDFINESMSWLLTTDNTVSRLISTVFLPSAFSRAERQRQALITRLKEAGTIPPESRDDTDSRLVECQDLAYPLSNLMRLVINEHKSLA